MIPKHKIRLSKTLKAQTTPYPNASRWLKRGGLVLLVVLLVGIYALAGKNSPEPVKEITENEKQILGETDENGEFETYRVKSGDTLFNISQRFQVDWQELAELNNLQEPYLLRVGQELRIPKQ